MVSRRWHDVVHSAPLLATPQLSASAPDGARARSLAAWLRRHGAKLDVMKVLVGDKAATLPGLLPELPALFGALASAPLERLSLSSLCPAQAVSPSLQLPPLTKHLKLHVHSEGSHGGLPAGLLQTCTGLEALHLIGAAAGEVAAVRFGGPAKGVGSMKAG